MIKNTLIEKALIMALEVQRPTDERSSLEQAK
jgi:hypothetical protein